MADAGKDVVSDRFTVEDSHLLHPQIIMFRDEH
jgi:hypothetical protein